MAAQLESEKAGREAEHRELDAAAERIRIHEQSLEQKERALREKEETIQSLQVEKTNQTQLAEQAAQRVIKEYQETEDAKRRASELEQAAAASELRAVRTAKVSSVLIGLLAVGLFELMIRSVHPWTWLLNHPNGYGLEGCFCLILFCGIVAFGVKQWRSTLLVAGLVGALLVALQIVGGSRIPSP